MTLANAYAVTKVLFGGGGGGGLLPILNMKNSMFHQGAGEGVKSWGRAGMRAGGAHPQCGGSQLALVLGVACTGAASLDLAVQMLAQGLPCCLPSVLCPSTQRLLSPCASKCLFTVISGVRNCRFASLRGGV